MDDVTRCFACEGGFRLSDALAEQIINKAEDVYLQAGENIIEYGKIDTNVYVVAEGVLRIAYFDGNREQTNAFMDKGTIFMSLHGYFAGKPAFFYYQACCRALVKKIPKEYFDSVIRNSHEFSNWIYSVAIHQLYGLERRASLIYGTVKERYIAFIKNRPNIVKNVPMKIIAGYLGVDPSYLCRIKKTSHTVPDDDSQSY